MAIAIVLSAPPLPAQEEPGKLRVTGTTLIYDTDAPGEGEEEGIRDEDVDTLLGLLRANPGITLLQLNSAGGGLYPARRIADTVIDFGLDTRVEGDCDSACVTVFLAGERRSMARGSRLGFHQPTWSVANIIDYYESERENEGWETPFDFVKWVYEDTQNEVYLRLKFMVSRGVDPAFAIEAVRDPVDDLWRPRRAELLKAGVLTE